MVVWDILGFGGNLGKLLMSDVYEQRTIHSSIHIIP